MSRCETHRFHHLIGTYVFFIPQAHLGLSSRMHLYSVISYSPLFCPPMCTFCSVISYAPFVLSSHIYLLFCHPICTLCSVIPYAPIFCHPICTFCSVISYAPFVMSSHKHLYSFISYAPMFCYPINTFIL